MLAAVMQAFLTCWLQYLGSKEVKKLVGLESTKDSIAKMKVSLSTTLTVSACRTGLIVGSSANTCSATTVCVEYIDYLLTNAV